MAGTAIRQIALTTVAVLALAGCQQGGGFAAKPGGGAGAANAGAAAGAGTGASKPAKSVKLVDRDVEAPQVFQVTDQALWDGRPSLGGVWVASPDAKDPERVIMRNTENGKFVIGALFRRERDNPGPPLQISSDAATALGLLAGQPGKVSVTALRREDAATDPAEGEVAKPILDANESVATAALDDGGSATAGTASAPAAAAPAAQATATAAPSAAPAPAKPERKGLFGKRKQKAAAVQPVSPGAAPVIAPAVSTTPLDGAASAQPPATGTAAAPAAAKPAATAKAAAPAPAASGGLIQIGIFSVEANAKRAVDTLKKAGVAASVRTETTQGKTYWSVTARGDGATLSKVKDAGFKDAYSLKR